jgi:hypothetical protein
MIMNTRSDPASLELNAINALFQEIWAMQRKKRQVSPRGAESLLEEIAERVRDCMERRLTASEITMEVLSSYGLGMAVSEPMKRAA